MCNWICGEKTKISFLWWGGNPNNFYDTAKAEFEALYPDIEVELILARGEAQTVKVAGGIGDVLITDNTGINVPSGALMPLNSLLEKDPAFLSELQKDFWPGSYKWTERKGKIYALPLMWTQGLVLFYNKDRFQNTGLNYPDYRTWNDFVTPLRKLSTREGEFGIQGVSNNWTALHQMSIINGGGMFDDPSYPTKGTLDSPKVLETAKFWVDLGVKDKVIGGMFNTGKAAMHIIWWGQLANWKVLPFDVDMAVVPPGPSAGNNVMYPAATAQLAIPTISKHPNEAYLWIKFLLSPRMMKLATVSGAGVPTRRSVAMLPEWAHQGGRNNQAVIQTMMNAVPTQPITGALNEFGFINTAITAAFKGELDLIAALRSMNEQVTALVQQYDKW
jgi:ABC-type glycerol-3-phosphate transport system substrate-binding protein